MMNKNDNEQYLEGFYAYTNSLFGIAWLDDCYVCSENIGIIKTFSVNEANRAKADQMYISIYDFVEPITDKSKFAKSFKYGLFIYEDVDNIPDEEYDDRPSATMLLSNNPESFITCFNILAHHHIVSNNLEIAQNFPWTVVPEDKKFKINSVTVNGKTLATDLIFDTFNKMYNSHNTVNEIITSPLAEM